MIARGPDCDVPGQVLFGKRSLNYSGSMAAPEVHGDMLSTQIGVEVERVAEPAVSTPSEHAPIVVEEIDRKIFKRRWASALRNESEKRAV